MQIAFGSDGYRGIIGHRLTREAIARIILSVRSTLNELNAADSGAPIPIGFDTRFLAREQAGYAARLLIELGFTPQVSPLPCPSPYLAFAVKHLGAPIGLQFTASHNPPCYGGIKLKGAHGGSLYPEQADLVESLANYVDLAEVEDVPFIATETSLKALDIDAAYKKALWQAAGWNGDRDTEILVDFMHGATYRLYGGILAEAFNLNTELHTDPDPLFGGDKPEPKADRLNELVQRVTYSSGKAIGLAFDGDGDRLAVVDEQGRLLAPHEIFCLLLEHLAHHHRKRGVVVTTVSFSGLVERVARAHDCLVLDVPVGFKHVSRAMQEEQAIMGGEESGGTGFGHYLPERDALLMALMLLHARQLAGTPLSEMVEQLYRTYGRPVFIRRDLRLAADYNPEELKRNIRDLASLTQLACDDVVSLNHRDGMKLRTNAGWVLVRSSGTEPLVRVYAEGDSAEQANAYADAAVANLTVNLAENQRV
ncbi:hypothetical protein JW859_01050 [bacterium]|nr:hypothetical protein [bacterium]